MPEYTPGRMETDGRHLMLPKQGDRKGPRRVEVAYVSGAGVTSLEAEANARRLAAAWNAVLGMTTEDVEGLDVARLMRDRGELLGACEKAASAAGQDWLQMQLMLAEVVAVVEGDARG
jgi:hypothetical protein